MTDEQIANYVRALQIICDLMESNDELMDIASRDGNVRAMIDSWRVRSVPSGVRPRGAPIGPMEFTEIDYEQ